MSDRWCGCPRWSWILSCLLASCYQPPSLPLIPDVPVEARPFLPCRGEDEGVVVACIVDGDTLDLGACGAQDRVRLLGIDAPELSPEPECWAEEATAFLQSWLQGLEVTASYDRSCTDPFGRALAYLWIRGDALQEVLRAPGLESFVWSWYLDPQEPAILLNEALLGLGMVRDYPESLAGTLAFQDRLDAARQRAVRSERGLWGACPDAR